MSDSIPAARPPADGVAELQALLARGVMALGRLPAPLEAEFRAQARRRAAHFLRLSVFFLIAIYLLVVLPGAWNSQEAGLALWLRYAVWPIGGVLAALLVITRVPALERHVEWLLGLGLLVCLAGTLYASLLLGDTYFGRMAAYETIYILAIAFSILRLPVRQALAWSLAALLLALLPARWQGLEVPWLDLLLSFLVPLLIGTVIALMLEMAERRSFVKTRLLAGAAYATGPTGLQLVSTWGLAAEPWGSPAALAMAAALLQPVGKSGAPQQLMRLPEGFMRIRGATGRVSPQVALVAPVYCRGELRAFLVLGRLDVFPARHGLLVATIAAAFGERLAAAG